ncbi:nitroreductase [Thiomicrorhabdus indica]|uniref:nitroreductase family protein n=1 Tax=Thiomicrorhabdus indica TaxID=2267253 RepID=UPI002AA95FC9|nr:nitroreductase [Thiomicrorhabdus indica]
MNAFELLTLIKSRRTCYQFSDRPVEFAELENCLEAAIWAPNHKLTQPWRFWVVSEAQQKALAETYAKLRAESRAEPNSENYQMIYDAAVEKFLKIPKMVLVGQALADDELVRKEDYAACSCAIQNFQLMAWQMGMGVQWSTGPIIKDNHTYQQINADSQQIELIGVLYIGHLKGDCSTQNGKRKPLSEVVFGL